MNFSDIFDFPYFKFLVFSWSIFLVLFVLYVYAEKKKFRNELNNFLLGLGLISLGFVTGIIMSNNRNPISDTVITSIFALLGGIMTYAFFQKDSKNSKTQATQDELKHINENKNVVALFLILFSVSFLYGSHTGGKFRIENEVYYKATEYNQKLKLDSLEIWKKRIDHQAELQKLYYQSVYQTWSENEKKRFEKQLSLITKRDSIPEVPEYSDTTKH